MPALGSKINRFLFFLILISLSVSPAFATDVDDQRNYFLIACMLFGPVIVIFSGKIIPKIDFPVFAVILISFATQIMRKPETFRASTLLFSCMFYIYFLAAIRCFRAAKMPINKLEKILKYLIYAYAVVLLIQQFCVLTGLPVFNMVAAAYKNKWKLNSLSAEPSHTARYLGLLMYSFLTICDIASNRPIGLMESFKRYRWAWLSFLWVMITSVSGTAMVILFLILTRYIRPRNIAYMAAFVAIVFAVGLSSDFKPLKRSTTFVGAVLTGDTDKMIRADHSASIRVVPTILCAQRIDPTTADGWLGSGIDSTGKWMSKSMVGVEDGWSGGGVALYLLEYGLVVGLIFMVLSFWCCFDKRHILCTLGFWVMCILFEGINMQMAWLCILLLYIDKRVKLTERKIATLIN